MKQLLATDTPGSYAFDKTAKTVTFSGLRQSITLSNILLITNVTANTIIYNFADSTKGAVSFNNNVLTLDYDTSSMANTDVLQIFLDLPSNEESLHDLLRRMNKLLESNAVVDNRLRQRITIDAIGNSTAGQSPTEVTTTIPVSGTVTASVAGATTLSITSNDLQYVQSNQVSPYATKANTTLLHVVSGIVDERWRIIEEARTAYGTAIRPNLIFT
jgi:hypothetical protein